MSAAVTPWFPAKTKPVRQGVYEVKSPNGERYAFWNGKRFGYRTFSPYDAFLERGSRTLLPARTDWRGLASDPKASKP